MARHFVIATAGHVDHGKSALVRALTAVDPDRLPEEKARGITIELGFASLDLSSADGAGGEFKLGIIDVPGHEDFVKNMVSGVGCVHLGLVVVAADDGWMPQTEEHLQILEYMGVRDIVIALNKIDLVGSDDEAFLHEVIRDELQGSLYSDAPIIATSTQTGQGIEAVKEKLSEVLEGLPDPVNHEKPRLSVDRAFSVKGHGTVVTGTLMDGELTLGQSVVVQPHGAESRVRTLQSFSEEVDRAMPGTRVAVNLANLAVRRSGDASHEGVARGDVVTIQKLAVATRLIDCIVSKSQRLVGKSGPAAKPLKHGARVRLHHGSCNVPGRVFFQDREELKPGETAPAQLRLEGEAMVLVGDRFVLRDWSEVITVGGGMVVDVDGDTRRFRRPEQKRFFEQCLSNAEPLVGLVEAIIGKDLGVPRDSLLLKSCFGAERIEAAVDKLSGEDRLLTVEGWLFERAFWDQELALAKRTIDLFHKQNSELLGVAPTELRSQLNPFWNEGDSFAVLLRALEEDNYSVVGTVVKRRDHQISLPANLAASANRIRSTLGDKLLEPPGRKQLIQGAEDERAIRYLLDVEEAVEVGEDLVFLKTGIQRLESMVREYLQAHDGGTVSELRQHTGVSRRIILPVLEVLDRRGVTVRDGDVRRLASEA